MKTSLAFPLLTLFVGLLISALFNSSSTHRERSQCQWSDSVMLTCLSKQHGAVGRINPLVKHVNTLR